MPTARPQSTPAGDVGGKSSQERAALSSSLTNPPSNLASPFDSAPASNPVVAGQCPVKTAPTEEREVPETSGSPSPCRSGVAADSPEKAGQASSSVAQQPQELLAPDASAGKENHATGEASSVFVASTTLEPREKESRAAPEGVSSPPPQSIGPTPPDTGRTEQSAPPLERPSRPPLSDQQEMSHSLALSGESTSQEEQKSSSLQETKGSAPMSQVSEKPPRPLSTSTTSHVITNEEQQSRPVTDPSTHTGGASEEASWEGYSRRKQHLSENTFSESQRHEGDAEHLIPIKFRPTNPADQFFVHFIEDPTNIRSVEAASRNQQASVGETKADATTQPRNEEEMMLEQFAEFTDDDSFFSSGSSVLSTDPKRMEEDALRPHAVSSVKETLFLRSLKNGYAAPEDWVNQDVDVHWLYQVHHRAMCLDYSSFFVFPARWTPRVMVYNALHHWVTEAFIGITVFVYAVFQACWARYPTPFMGDPFPKPQFMLFGDVFFTVLLTIEVLLRLFSCGVILHPRAFFRSPWHWLDLAVLILMYMTCTNWREMWNFTAWRLIRVIRCCRYLPIPVCLKVMAKSFLRATTRLFSVTLYLIFFTFFFALLGLHLFKGTLRARCVDDVTGSATSQICNPKATGSYWFYWGHRCESGFSCVQTTLGNPNFSFRSYDDIGHALLSTFQILTFQGWTSLLTETNDGLNTLAFLYYLFVIVVCSLIIPAMYIGVFVEKFIIVKRRFFFKQVSKCDAILTEQRLRQHAGVRLKDFVVREEDGRVSHFPNYDKHIIEDKVYRSLHKPLSDMKWTDEKRIQLHLSLTRQAALAKDSGAEAYDAFQADASKTGAGGNHHSPDTLKGEFLLGGRVGELQHHVDEFGVGEEPGNPEDFRERQKAAVAPFTFLESYKEKREKESKQLEGVLNKSEVGAAHQAAKDRSGSNASRMRSVSDANKALLTTREGRESIPDQKVLKILEPPGVVPPFQADPVSMSTSDNSFGKNMYEEEDLELIVHDPEGGDFEYTRTCCQKWGIIRNMVHVFTEGCPRIITQYLWDYRMLNLKYGLRPLEYTNKYEDSVLQLLRRRRIEEIRDMESHLRRCRPPAALQQPSGDDADVEDEEEGPLHTWDEREERHILENPMRMAEKIYENARPTPFNIAMYVLIFLNGVFNAFRFVSMPDAWHDALFYISVIISVLLAFELVLHLVALGPGPFLYHGFYPLELIAVILSLFELGFDRSNAISVFSWIRFLRLARVAPVRPLRNVTRVLLTAFPDLLIGLLFFSVYMFMWLLIGMSFFGSRFAELAPTAEYSTRGNFDIFSYAMYAIAQVFSVNRDQWLYLSWSGMRARGGYTIMYFMAATMVAFIFRFFFIAICTYAWQVQAEQSAEVQVNHLAEMMEHQLVKQHARLTRRSWFDFSVWRSFKHLHGGFERRNIAPDDVYHLQPDMQRHLRAAEARSRYYKTLYKDSEEEVAAAHHYGEKEAVKYISVGGRLHKRYAADDDEEAVEATLTHVEEEPTTSVPAVACEGLVTQKCAQYCNDCEFNVPPLDSPSADPNRFRHLYSNGGEALLIPNPIHAGRHSLSPQAGQWKPETVRAPSRGVSAPALDASLPNSRGPSAALSRKLVEMYPGAPVVSAQFYSLLRSPEEENDEGAAESSSPAAAEKNRPRHILLPGPVMKPYYKPLDGFQRVLDRCRNCNCFKQVPLPPAKGVVGRDADDLHQEHCHVAAVRSARQTVLDALLGYVTAQEEHEVKPTREMMETVLGQAWSCGLLMFETMENVLDESIPLEERDWTKMHESLTLQEWLTNLQVGEEQVGRSALAYLLAHQAQEDQQVTLRRVEAPFAAAERPDSIWNNDKAFFFLEHDSIIRSKVGNFVHSMLFEFLVLCVIYAATICLAIYTPGEDNRDMGGSYNSSKYKILHGFDDFFVVLFVIEMVLRWIADGVVLPAGRAYFWHLWNIFDFFIVIVSLVSIFDTNSYLRYLKVFRCFRLVKHVRYCQWPNVSVLAHSLCDAMPTLANVGLLMLGNYIVWAIIFCSMFYNKMSMCSEKGITLKKACESQGYQWVEAYDRTFSNFYKSLLTTFEISTGAEWMDVMYHAVDSWSSYAEPITDSHAYLGLVFVAYYYISHFVFFALLSSAVVHSYMKTRNAIVGVEETASAPLARWQRMRSMLHLFTPRMKLLPFSFPLSRFFHAIVTHWVFEVVMAVIIVLNAFFMSLEWYGMSSGHKTTLDVFQYIFLAFFTAEIILRLVAHGTLAFTRGAFCWDVLVTLLSYIQIGLNTTDDHLMPIDVNVLRLLRVGRLLNLFCFTKSPRYYATLLHVCITSATTDLIAVAGFFSLSVLVFAVAGLHFLGYIVPFGGYLSFPYNNFYTFVNSIIMVFRLSTLENWSTMLHDSMDKGNYCARGSRCGPSNWAPVYYIALLLCCFVLAGSLFMGVVVYHYMSLSRMFRDIMRWEDLYVLREAWSSVDTNARGELPTSCLPGILEKLRPPLGVYNRFNRVELLRTLQAYHIPETRGMVRYDDVLQAVARRVIAMAIVEKEIGASRQKHSYDYSWRVMELQLAVFDAERNVAEKELLRLGFFNLPSTAAKALNSFRPQKVEDTYHMNASHSTEEYFAASYIQAAYRRDKATRDTIVRRSHFWGHGRQACDALKKDYADYGFSQYSLAGPDPALEGTVRGFAVEVESTYLPTPRTGGGPPTASGARVYAAAPNSGAEKRNHSQGAAPLSASNCAHLQPASHPAQKQEEEEALVGEHPVLPEMYKTAIHPKKKVFGPEAEGAIRRGERRSEKLAKDAAMAAQSQPRRRPSAFSDSDGDEQCSNDADDSFAVSRSSDDAEGDVLENPYGYQPPLGVDVEVLREVERRRRARHQATGSL